jgi:hypothetical protein
MNAKNLSLHKRDQLENNTIGESDEWRSWYALGPQNRWTETQKLWDFYQKTGGSLDPEPDSQSPFHNAWLPGAFSAHGRTGVRIIRKRSCRER